MALSQVIRTESLAMPSQLTFADREKISQMIYTEASDAEIARAIGRSRATVYRERTRNSIDGVYLAIQPQAASEKRRASRPIVRKMEQPKIDQ